MKKNIGCTTEKVINKYFGIFFQNNFINTLTVFPLARFLYEMFNKFLKMRAIFEYHDFLIRY